MGARSTQKLVEVFWPAIRCSRTGKLFKIYNRYLLMNYARLLYLLLFAKKFKKMFEQAMIAIVNMVKILNIYIMLSCTHLYHFFPVSIQCLQSIHCLLHQTLEIFKIALSNKCSRWAIRSIYWCFHHAQTYNQKRKKISDWLRKTTVLTNCATVRP